jgi:uncharacterized protein (DUF1810 family)
LALHPASGYCESGTADKAGPTVPKGASRLSDSFDLRRFIEAQEPVYRQIVEELSRGRKRSHWMWFVFPQIAGLGFSAMARRFAIGSRAEAVAYLRHDVLGPRLIECTRLVMASEKTIGRHEISIVHDVVRRCLSPGDFRRGDRGLLSGREGSCDAGNSRGREAGAAE